MFCLPVYLVVFILLLLPGSQVHSLEHYNSDILGHHAADVPMCCDHIVSPEFLMACVTNGSNQTSRVLLVSFMNDKIAEYGAWNAAVNAHYAAHMRYAYQMYYNYFPDIPSNVADVRWYKVLLVLSLMKGHSHEYDYIVWLDTDLIILDLEFDLISLVNASGNASIVASYDTKPENGVMNSGLMIFKVSNWTADFLTFWWENYDKDVLSDQGAFTDMYYKDVLRCTSSNYISLLPPHALNSVFPAYKNQLMDHQVLHLAGLDDELRKYIFKSAYENLCRKDSDLPQLGITREFMQRYHIVLPNIVINDCVNLVAGIPAAATIQHIEYVNKNVQRALRLLDPSLYGDNTINIHSIDVIEEYSRIRELFLWQFRQAEQLLGSVLDGTVESSAHISDIIQLFLNISIEIIEFIYTKFYSAADDGFVLEVADKAIYILDPLTSNAHGTADSKNQQLYYYLFKLQTMRANMNCATVEGSSTCYQLKKTYWRESFNSVVKLNRFYAQNLQNNQTLESVMLFRSLTKNMRDEISSCLTSFASLLCDPTSPASNDAIEGLYAATLSVEVTDDVWNTLDNNVIPAHMESIIKERRNVLTNCKVLYNQL